jgi:DNA-binding transcriptional LysR family regulator
MRFRSRLVAGLLLAAASASSALAQVPPGLPNPDLQNRIPAPLPPPPQPPIINGPLSQSPPPGVYQPPRLNTFSDRTAGCLQAGSAQGLRGRKLDAYTRRCAN